MKKFPLVIGHRGAMAYMPENTLSSFQKALELGAEIVEFDVRKTKDNHLIVVHDAGMKRTAGREGKVKNLTSKEIRSFVMDKNKRIPTLEETIDALKGKAQMNIEIKARGIEKEVAAIIQKKNVEQSVIVSSFHHPTLLTLKRILPSVRIAPLFGSKDKISYFLYDGKKRIKPWSIHIDKKSAVKGVLKKAHQEGIKVFAYTSNKKKEMENLVRQGVDGIFTNKPDVLRELKKAMPAQRPG